MTFHVPARGSISRQASVDKKGSLDKARVPVSTYIRVARFYESRALTAVKVFYILAALIRPAARSLCRIGPFRGMKNFCYKSQYDALKYLTGIFKSAGLQSSGKVSRGPRWLRMYLTSSDIGAEYLCSPTLACFRNEDSTLVGPSDASLSCCTTGVSALILKLVSTQSVLWH